MGTPFIKRFATRYSVCFVAFFFLAEGAQLSAAPFSPASGTFVTAGAGHLEGVGYFKAIRGIVTDENGNPLEGVTVQVKNRDIGTITDSEGAFSLNVPEDATLVVSYIGYKQKEITVGAATNVTIQLEVTFSDLEQIVVVGYGKQKKVTVTGAISSVGNKELQESPTANLSNMLVGRLPGLLAVQPSGAPGDDASTLRIRGISTFSGSQEPLVLVDGVVATNYNNIDPNTVANISILKDASATALYGVRGANGVILITTKRGTLGKPKISFNSNLAVKSFTAFLQNMGSYDWARLYNEALRYDSYITGVYEPRFSEEDIELYRNGTDPVFHPNSNWIDKVFKPYSLQTKQALTVSGGTEDVKYFISGGYFVQGGLFNDKEQPMDLGYSPQTDFRRYNFRSNLDFNVTKNLTASVDIAVEIQSQQTRVSLPQIMETMLWAPPVASPGIVDGKIVEIPGVVSLVAEYSNPLVYFFAENTRVNGSNLNGNVRLNYDLGSLVKGLSVAGALSYKSFSGVTRKYGRGRNLPIYNPVRLPDETILYVPINAEEQPLSNNLAGVSKHRRIYTELKLDYERIFGDHQVSGLLLYNQGTLYDPGLQFGIPHAYQGLVGRVTYNYKSRYLLEFDAGYNGTENFAEGRRFGFFPAYSAGWVASEEPFFPANDYLTFLKFRGSYGVVGNDQIGGERFLYLPSSYFYGDSYHFGEVGSTYNTYTISNEGKIGNPMLTWEKAKKTNIGVDMRLFKDKISLTTDVFFEKRSNILTNMQSLPSIVGANLPAFNIGRMENKGVDGSVTFNDRAGNFNYWVKANYTFSRNKVLFMDEIPRKYGYQSRTGLSFGQHFGTIAQGFYNSWDETIEAIRPVSKSNYNRKMPGDVKYKDVNGDGYVDEYDGVPIGYTDFPGQTFSFSFGGDFKGFYLSVLFQGASDYSHKPGAKYYTGWREDGSSPQVLVDRTWTPERAAKGLPISMPHVSASKSQTDNYMMSTLLLEDATYLRLRNMEVGYVFSGGFISRMKLESLRLYVNGNNLYTWDKLLSGEDPDIPTRGALDPYPITKTFNVGIDIKF